MPRGAFDKFNGARGAAEKRRGEPPAAKGSHAATPVVSQATVLVRPRACDGCDAQVLPGVPRDITACEGGCAVLPNTARQTFRDLADLWLSPMIPGPLHVAGVLGTSSESSRRGGGGASAAAGRPSSASDAAQARPTASLEDRGRLERLWELRLCVEELRDSLEAFSAGGPDALFTAEEALDVVEGILRRIVELGLAQASSAPPLGRRSAGAAGVEPIDGGDVLRAIASLSGQRGALTHCLLSSGLLVSGLLEAVLGELTDWRSTPSDTDLRLWRAWDGAYERLARRAEGAWDTDLSAVCCGGAGRCGHAEGPAVEVGRPLCAPLCRWQGF